MTLWTGTGLAPTPNDPAKVVRGPGRASDYIDDVIGGLLYAERRAPVLPTAGRLPLDIRPISNLDFRG